MSDCKNCPLNKEGECFDADLLRSIESSMRELFICRKPEDIPFGYSDELCSINLWVLIFISQGDQIAQEHAEETMDKLVEGGYSELLCHLFENSNYQTRKILWTRMTKIYPERLYLFNILIEREELVPAMEGEIPRDMQVYRYNMLY